MATSAVDLDAIHALCPRCVAREQGPSGFCSPCLEQRIVEDYRHGQAEKIAARRSAWQERSRREEPSSASIATRERQRRHRLLERIRPREPARAETDPYELAQQGLLHLSRVRGALRSQLTLPDLAAAEEIIRQLAWGPAR